MPEEGCIIDLCLYCLEVKEVTFVNGLDLCAECVQELTKKGCIK